MEGSKEAGIKSYCAFCETGREESVIRRLSKMGYAGFTPYAIRKVYEDKKHITVKRPLLPGYVFFESGEISNWTDLHRAEHILRILRYESGSYALMGRDLEFVNWIRRNDGCIDISRVYREGDRIRVVDGPLKDYEGKIVKYNPKRRCVAIMIGSAAIPIKVWCSVELITPD